MNRARKPAALALAVVRSCGRVTMGCARRAISVNPSFQPAVLMLYAYYTLVAVAIATMVAGLVLALRLRRIARGGRIGRAVNLLIALIVLFLGGYLVAPWMPRMPPALGWLVMSLIYLFGALYVVLVLTVISGLVREVMKDLES